MLQKLIDGIAAECAESAYGDNGKNSRKERGERESAEEQAGLPRRRRGWAEGRGYLHVRERRKMDV